MNRVKCRTCRYFRLKKTLDKVWHSVCTFTEEDTRVNPDKEHVCEFYTNDLDKE